MEDKYGRYIKRLKLLRGHINYGPDAVQARENATVDGDAIEDFMRATLPKYVYQVNEIMDMMPAGMDHQYRGM